MVASALCFASMSVVVKWASPQYGAGEIVFYRSLVGLVAMALMLRAQGIAVSTPRPGMHFWRSLSGTLALVLWTFCIAGTTLGTAMTLNYMSSVWMGAILVGAALMARKGDKVGRPDGRLLLAVLLGFAGVAMVLQPWTQGGSANRPDALLAGLASGLLAAVAYLQVSALGRAGEPEARVVFYFALCGCVLGLGTALAGDGLSGHDLRGATMLLAIGLLATAGQWLMTVAYRHGPVLVNAALHYLGIVFGLAFGALFFAERPGLLALLGTTTIIAAGLWATLLRARP
jgi:S-adenosylmethionine uptake transporter